MGSLTTHLLDPGDHGRLRFHPSCPVCRQERLYGTLSSEPVVPRRAQALLAGGLLAISSSAPAVAIAQEPDRQSEGVAAPEDLGVHELDDPSFDPGGDTALSFDTAPAPNAPEDGEDSGDGAPLDVEPTVDLDARVAPLAETSAPVTDTSAPPSEEESGVPPAGSVLPVEAGTQSSAPPSPPIEQPAQVADQGTSPRVGPDAHLDLRSDADAPASPPRVSDGAGAPSDEGRFVTPAPPPASTVSPPAVPSTPAAEPVALAQTDLAAPAGRQQAPLGRNASSYVVQPGDSLWSIAKRLLGSDASPARIAREVNRLWSLNRDRIATGDPDLLMVGTRLDLR
jgi:nucleoid-associated protein YgaU